MRNSVLILSSLLILFINNFVFAQSFSKEWDEKTNSDILVGLIKSSTLKKKPYKQWFNKNYRNYKVDIETVKKIKKNNLRNNIQVLIIMGTWCKDSKREVPRFLKVLKKLHYNLDKIEIICVDRTKNISVKEFESIKIEHIPDFIFFQNHKEVGRIVETPDESIEKDMYRILVSTKSKVISN